MDLWRQLSKTWAWSVDRLLPRISPDPQWAQLAASWDARFPECPPVAHELRGSHDLWVRFHSLPAGKRYASSEDEHAEVLARHHAVLTALGAPGGELLVVTMSWSPSTRPRRRDRQLARSAPNATLWRSLLLEQDEYGAVWWHLFVTSVAMLVELDPLLRLVADDQAGGVILMPRDLSWLYHPYDGGVDVIARSTVERDALASRFVGWLSDHPLGL